MVESVPTKPHILLVSFPGQGHINPLLRLAKRIASKGPLVTLSSTISFGRKIHSNTRLPESNRNNIADDQLIPVGKGHLRFEFFSDGWEDDDDPRRYNLDSLMAQLRTFCAPALSSLIQAHRAQGRPVTCLINNPFIPWALDVAHDLSIPSAVLWVQSSAVFSTYYHYFHSLSDFPSLTNPELEVKLPGLPTLKPHELPSFLLPTTPYKSLTDAILAQFGNLQKATWVFVNSFEELERSAIEAMSTHVPLIPVGPLVEATASSSNGDGIKSDMWKAADCMEWLDAQEKGTVVYVSVGSVVILTREEMGEMAAGLVRSGRPFLWVVRENCQDLLPESFLEKECVKGGKGMVVGWSPQEAVLGHVAVGCFLTHCGWNSTLEVLTSGVPVVTYPQWGDQVTNSKFLVEEYGVGVRLEAPVRAEELARCVDEVLGDGEVGEKVRERCAEWKEAARRAVETGGTSEQNIEKFIKEVVRRAVIVGGET